MSEHIIRNVRIVPISVDWDSQALMSISAGKGFRITEPGISDIDPKGGKYSIHSPLYGTDYKDDHAFEDRYSCECGELTGSNYEGVICKKCKSKVEYIGIDMTITGWIILDNDCIIQSLFFKKIRSYIGPKVFDAMIKFIDPVKRDIVDGQPYSGIGILEFRERFDEIMNHYYKNTPKKVNLYRFIMSQKDIVFTHSIPVYSSHLRLFVMKNSEIKYSDEDKLYKTIFTNSQLLNDDFELTRRVKKTKRRTKYNVDYLRKENILYRTQMSINKLWDLSFDTIKKKQGVIRNSIIGGRINYTARNVIVPDKTLRADEISLGYATVLELYKLEIISLLTKLQGIDHQEAWDKWEKASIVYDELIYKIMCYIINNKEYPAVVEINRNPTIDYGSKATVKIAKIYKDNVMGMPISVLTPMNADFDGDTLNIVCKKITSMATEYYTQSNPRSNFFIDRNDGGYNKKTSLLKDQIIGLFTFANS